MGERGMSMAKKRTSFVCRDCGYETPKWMGKCPSCNQWNTLEEELVVKTSSKHRGLGQDSKQRPEK